MTQDSKSSSIESGRSVPNSGSVASLADRLKAKTAQEAGAIQQVTQNELDLHQKNLRDMSTLALDTTRSVIENQVGEITSLLTAPSSAISQASSEINRALSEASSSVKVSANGTATAIEKQQSDIRSEMVKQQQFLLWMMKLPMLGVLTFCLLVCAGTWVWSEYRINQAEERETVAAQKVAEREALIDSLTLEFCKTPAGKKACSTPK